MQLFSKFLIFFISFLGLGCSYTWNHLQNSSENLSLFIPYVTGDEDGAFTSELASTLQTFGFSITSKEKADAILQISIQNSGSQTIGYRWDKQKISGELKDNIVDCEARRFLTAEVILKKNDGSNSSKTLEVTSDSDYDYVDGDCLHDLQFINSYGVKTLVLPFSLGQLEPKEAALEASTKPLYKKLSLKIANSLFMLTLQP